MIHIYIWYVDTDGIHRMNRSDDEEVLFMEWPGLFSMSSLGDWLYVNDGTLDETIQSKKLYYEGYKLDASTGNIIGEARKLEGYLFGMAVLKPAIEPYDYLCMGNDFSRRLISFDNGNVMYSAGIEDMASGEIQLYIWQGMIYIYMILKMKMRIS